MSDTRKRRSGHGTKARSRNSSSTASRESLADVSGLDDTLSNGERHGPFNGTRNKEINNKLGTSSASQKGSSHFTVNGSPSSANTNSTRTKQYQLSSKKSFENHGKDGRVGGGRNQNYQASEPPKTARTVSKVCEQIHLLLIL